MSAVREMIRHRYGGVGRPNSSAGRPNPDVGEAVASEMFGYDGGLEDEWFVDRSREAAASMLSSNAARSLAGARVSSSRPGHTTLLVSSEVPLDLVSSLAKDAAWRANQFSDEDSPLGVTARVESGKAGTLVTFDSVFFPSSSGMEALGRRLGADRLRSLMSKIETMF